MIELSSLLDPAALTPERIVHWLVHPLFSEGGDDLMLPIMSGERPLVLALRGLVLPITPQLDDTLRVEGHTSQYNARLDITLSESGWEVRGQRDGHAVDYKIGLLATQVSIQGQTGHHHADATVDLEPNSLRVQGNLAGDHSEFEAVINGGTLRVMGLEHSENVHYDIATSGGEWHWQGEMAQGFTDLKLHPAETGWLLNGQLYNEPCRLTLGTTAEGLKVEGFTGWGPVHFEVRSNEAGLVVAGRSDKSHLDYKVIF
ncbi:MAG TPA: hypothetical protein VGO93_12295 [Candidatus Xenobia bacterium]|jgi:hypothetical protein